MYIVLLCNITTCTAIFESRSYSHIVEICVVSKASHYTTHAPTVSTKPAIGLHSVRVALGRHQFATSNLTTFLERLAPKVCKTNNSHFHLSPGLWAKGKRSIELRFNCLFMFLCLCWAPSCQRV